VTYPWKDMHSWGFIEVADISLLVPKLSVQSENREFESKGKERYKEEKSGWRTLDIGWGILGSSLPLMKNLQSKFQEIWGKFCQKTGFWPQRVACRTLPWRSGGRNHESFAFLGLSWWNTPAQKLPRHFIKVWVPKRSKNMQKMTSLPLFGHTGSSLGRMHFWRGI